MAAIPMTFVMTVKALRGYLKFHMPMTALGGPFPEVSRTKFSVCLKAEASKAERATATVWLPIEDFSVPKEIDVHKVRQTVKEALLMALSGQTISAGCLGGTGRTGLFLALLLKTAGSTDPVKDVRALYKPHAVETAEQKAYVDKFDVSSIQEDLFWPTVKAALFSRFFSTKA